MVGQRGDVKWIELELNCFDSISELVPQFEAMIHHEMRGSCKVLLWLWLLSRDDEKEDRDTHNWVMVIGRMTVVPENVEEMEMERLDGMEGGIGEYKACDTS